VTLRVAVDFGTSSTCVAISVDGREPQVVVVDGQPLVPSAVYAAPDGTVFVGQEAERQAALDPSRYEPHPKRRIDESELLLGSSVLSVLEVVRAVLSRAVGEARRLAGGAPADLLVLTHPADWGAIRTRVLRQAGHGLAHEMVLVPEPVAAAVFHSAGQRLPEGAALAVLDLGGGTVDASVVRMQGNSFAVLATRGDPTFGGADIDQALLEYVGGLVAKADQDAWQKLVEGRELADRRRRRILRHDVRGAKETLSRHTYSDIPMPPPFPDAHVTRGDLERLVAEPLARAVKLVVATAGQAQLSPQRLAGVFLVGGSSRIPLVARLVHEHTGVMPITMDQPETVVARGALRAVTLDPDRTGGLPGLQPQPRPPAPVTRSAGRVGSTTRPLYQLGPPTPGHGLPTTGQGLLIPGQASTPVGFLGPVFPAVPSVPRQPTTAAAGAPRKGRRGVTAPWLIAGGVVVVAAAVAGVMFAFAPGSGQPSPTPQTNSQSQPATNQRKDIAQYDYRFTVPAGWEQSGGAAERRMVQLKPIDAQPETDLIAAQETRLNYDSSLERDRAVSDLRQQFNAGGPTYSGFTEKFKFAGKDVSYYRQQLTAATVEWYVLFQGKVQLSVGCQYTEPGKVRVLAACDEAVRTLSITG
jgi:type VII secretion-associated protein (TIGR03931 family)